MDEVLDSQDMNHFMVFQSRRKNISVVFVTQNIYQSGKYSVTQRYVLAALRKGVHPKILFFSFSAASITILLYFISLVQMLL